MSLFNIFSQKKAIKEELVSQKEYYTSEEIEAIACKGFRDKWQIGIRDNPNLFPVMFEWRTIGEYKSILCFKSFRTEELNYAPVFTSFDDSLKEFFHEDGKSDPVSLKTTFFGYVILKYPVEKCAVRILAPIYNEMYKRNHKPVEDFSDILEIDFSPEAILNHEQEVERMANEAKAKREREEIEAIKEKLLKKKRKEQLEKMALRELMDEGILFPEAGKRPPIPKDVVDAVWRRDGGRCVYCGSTENLQLDHIIPFSKGGATTVENLQLLCQECNLQRSNKIG